MKVTLKQIQVHFECICGLNVVDQHHEYIKYKDFKALGVRRKKDKTTGKYFLVLHEKVDQCQGNELD